MRRLRPIHWGRGMPEGSQRGSGWGERTAADLSSLLVELSRAVKGLAFYEADHPARRDLVDRAYLAWRVDLDRSGPISLQTGPDSFRADGVDESIAHGHLADLGRLLRERGLDRIGIGEDLSRGAFQSLLELLSLDDREIEQRGGFANAFAKSDVRGIALDGLPQPASRRARHPEAEAASPGGADGPVAPALDEESALLDALAEGPGVPESSLGSALLGATPGAGLGFEDLTKPTLEEDPLGAPSSGAEDDALRALLQELDGCADDSTYAEVASGVVGETHRVAEQGIPSAGYRAVLVLADHAVGHGGRSGVQLRMAQESLAELCRGAVLDEILQRASDAEGSVAVRGAQVLLQLGGRAVTPLLERIESEEDADRRGRMGSIVLALGERAVPILVATIVGDDPGRALTAMRLAGELQSPNLVRTLTNALDADSGELRREAARALAQTGTEPALRALVDALGSSRQGLPELAAGGLAAAGDARAVRPLLKRVDEAVEQRDVELARALIRALGELGNDQATPKLVALLERRSWLRREPRELKRAALEALARLPGREARRAVERTAASRREGPLAQRAQQLLAGDAEGSGRGAARAAGR